MRRVSVIRRDPRLNAVASLKRPNQSPEATQLSGDPRLNAVASLKRVTSATLQLDCMVIHG